MCSEYPSNTKERRQYVDGYFNMRYQISWTSQLFLLLKYEVKGLVHPKMKMLSSFTHPQVVPNLYECLCSDEHKGRYSEECGKQSGSGAPLTSIVCFFPTMEVIGAPKQPGYKLSSEYLPLCLAEHRHLYRFGTTWGWVNYDRIFIFGWTIPLNWKQILFNSVTSQILILKKSSQQSLKIANPH